MSFSLLWHAHVFWGGVCVPPLQFLIQPASQGRTEVFDPQSGCSLPLNELKNERMCSKHSHPLQMGPKMTGEVVWLVLLVSSWKAARCSCIPHWPLGPKGSRTHRTRKLGEKRQHASFLLAGRIPFLYPWRCCRGNICSYLLAVLICSPSKAWVCRWCELIVFTHGFFFPPLGFKTLPLKQRISTLSLLLWSDIFTKQVIVAF